MNSIRFLLATSLVLLSMVESWSDDTLRGLSVIPHQLSSEMRYRRAPDPVLSSRVQLFLNGPVDSLSIDGQSPDELLMAKEWAWHDFASAKPIPAGALGVRTFNGATARWGVGGSFELRTDERSQNVVIAKPTRWISSVTFLASEPEQMHPDQVVLHIANDQDQPLKLTGVRLWLPQDNQSWQVLWPDQVVSIDVSIEARDKGFVTWTTNPLPLSYAAVEVLTEGDSLWAHLRIKRESFDISGGWIGKHLKHQAYLDLLANLHINTGQIEEVDGYSNEPARVDRHLIKSFNRMMPLEKYDSDEWLPRIHAVEFLGEPQYGGGRPVPPQEVFDAFLPYRSSRLATTVTHSEERIWRLYAGLSDYPHFDAYRVVAPAADSWRAYDRWNGKSIRWGAPLETVGDLTRSLRDLNRPMPIAAWSQGPHDGWQSWFDGRRRRSPNGDELRSQALHAISSRITSLYWFNLSLESLWTYQDTWEPIRRLGRELHAMEPILLTGDAYQFERRKTPAGNPDWDLASIAAPSATLLFAIDTAYTIDEDANEFRFAAPRPAEFRFRMPAWHRNASQVVRVDGDGVHPMEWSLEQGWLIIQGEFSGDAIFLVSNDASEIEAFERRIQEAIEQEQAHGVDLIALEQLLKD